MQNWIDALKHAPNLKSIILKKVLSAYPSKQSFVDAVFITALLLSERTFGTQLVLEIHDVDMPASYVIDILSGSCVQSLRIVQQQQQQDRQYTPANIAEIQEAVRGLPYIIHTITPCVLFVSRTL
jgi:hypothetical protein